MDLNHARLPIPPRGLKEGEIIAELPRKSTRQCQHANPCFNQPQHPNLLSQYPYSIPSREEILGIFRSAAAPLDLQALASMLQVKAAALDVLTRRLNAMERDGQLRSDADGAYALADHSGFVAGKVSAHRDGFGFVIPDEPGEDLFLSDKEMQKVLHGDRVLAK
eukprot:gene58857-78533_t